MFGLRDDYMFTPRLRVACDTLRAITDLDIAFAVANPDLFARIFPRHRVAATLPRHIRIACYFPQLVIAIWISWPSGDRLQVELIRIPARRDLLMCGPVHALVSHFPYPGTQLRIEIIEAAGLAALQAAEKIPAYILHARLDLAFRLRPVRSTQPWCESPVTCEVQKHRMPDDLAAAVGFQPHRFHAVVQNFLRHAV
jgi:hypothetical protein